MVQKYKIYAILIPISLGILFALGYKFAIAENTQGVTVSPPSFELTLNPGETTTQTIRLTNPTGRNIEFYPKAMDFKANGETGEPSFYQAKEDTSKFALSQWVSFGQQKMVMTPEQVINFKYVISVPQDAEPGGHYGVVFFASDPTIDKNNNSSRVNLGSMVGSLIFVKVPGDISEQALIQDFSTNHAVYFSGKVDFITRIMNTGNIHIKPKGLINVKGMFGGTQKISFNDNGGYVLPDSTRKFTNSWKPSEWAFGRYTANLMLVYGTENLTLQKTISFWLIPWWLIISVAVILILALFFWWRRKRKKGRLNRTPSQQTNKILLR